MCRPRLVVHKGANLSEDRARSMVESLEPGGRTRVGFLSFRITKLCLSMALANDLPGPSSYELNQ